LARITEEKNGEGHLYGKMKEYFFLRGGLFGNFFMYNTALSAALSLCQRTLG
jgi:hypothetical protein